MASKPLASDSAPSAGQVLRRRQFVLFSNCSPAKRRPVLNSIIPPLHRRSSRRLCTISFELAYYRHDDGTALENDFGLIVWMRGNECSVYELALQRLDSRNLSRHRNRTTSRQWPCHGPSGVQAQLLSSSQPSCRLALSFSYSPHPDLQQQQSQQRDGNSMPQHNILSHHLPLHSENHQRLWEVNMRLLR